MTHLAFIDCETTGLDLERHEIWELALIVEDHPAEWRNGEYVWEFPVSLADADPFALKIGGWYERSIQWTQDEPRNYTAWKHTGVHANGDQFHDKVASSRCQQGMRDALREICILLKDAHLVGAMPHFDAYRLEHVLKKFDLLPTWHYHLVDIEALMIGYLAGYAARWYEEPPNDPQWGPATPGLPWKSDDLSRRIDVDPPSDDDRHTALGDARWTQRVYRKVTGQ